MANSGEEDRVYNLDPEDYKCKTDLYLINRNIHHNNQSSVFPLKSEKKTAIG